MKLKQRLVTTMNSLLPTIRSKVLFSYLFLIFVPLIILTGVSYVRVSKSYKEQIEYVASQSFDQANEFLYYKVNALIQASDIVTLNPSLQNILARQRHEVEGDVIQQNKDMMYLDNFLYSLKSGEDVYRVKIYVPDWLSYSIQKVNFDSISTFEQTELFQRLMNQKDKVLWTPPNNIVEDDRFASTVPVISMIRKIKNQDKLSENIGFVEISILQDMLTKIIQKANITDTEVVYIVNEYGELIGSSNDEKLTQLHLQSALKPYILEKNPIWQTLVIDTNKYIYRSDTIKNTDWHLVAVIPYEEILKQSYYIRNLMLFLLILVGSMSYGVAFIVSKSFTGRITLLSNTMVKVQDGDLDIQLKAEEQDEIGQLFKSFNYMITRIHVLVEERFKYGKEIKNAELKALQAQINPHFLYNTLDLINWKALDKEVPEIAEISQTLARFYKLSLNKGQDIVSLSDEINHVTQYVKIQNMRFENRIVFECVVDESLYEHTILKIILQPIVENSIMHGILKRPKQAGNITIHGAIDEQDVILTVEDNGIGIEPSKLSTILYATGTKESHGYGVKNIHERLQLCYGKQYGLKYESTVGVGTKVTIKIPK